MNPVSASVSSLSALSDTISEEPGKTSAEIRSIASGGSALARLHPEAQPIGLKPRGWLN